MPIERIAAASGAYSASVSVQGSGRWVYVSGVLGTDPDGALVTGGLYQEAKRVFENMANDLASAGASLSDVVRITAYLTDLENYADFSRARAETFGENLPASVAVGVSGLLFGASVEVDALAYAD